VRLTSAIDDPIKDRFEALFELSGKIGDRRLTGNWTRARALSGRSAMMQGFGRRRESNFMLFSGGGGGAGCGEMNPPAPQVWIWVAGGVRSGVVKDGRALAGAAAFGGFGATKNYNLRLHNRAKTVKKYAGF
jgi:hypothetical protein